MKEGGEKALEVGKEIHMGGGFEGGSSSPRTEKKKKLPPLPAKTPLSGLKNSLSRKRIYGVDKKTREEEKNALFRGGKSGNRLHRRGQERRSRLSTGSLYLNTSLLGIEGEERESS